MVDYLKKEKRMDLRDERVRLQRRLCPLKDIEKWEPENLTKEDKKQIRILECKIVTLYDLENMLKEAV
jgi:SepF-like predicted cell division protein (DUF552 family)